MLELSTPRTAAGTRPAGRRGSTREPVNVVSDSQPSQRRSGEVLEALEEVIASRRSEPPDRSYTSRLLASGANGTGAKVVEEADELVRAARGETDDRVVSEAADLLYHMLVLLACRDVPLARVESELARRFGASGLAEKAARGRPGGST